MGAIDKTTETEEKKIPVKMKLAALWAGLMFLYTYADIFSLYKPGQVDEIISGRMGPFPVTQGSLLTASILMLIPAVMIFLSVFLGASVGRWVNLLLGLIYTAVNIGNMVGETWAFYLLYGIVEMAITLLIVGIAWKWAKPESRSGSQYPA